MAVGIGLLHAARGIGTGVGPYLAQRALALGVAGPRLWQGAGWLAVAGVVAFALAATTSTAGPAATLAMLAAALGWGAGSGANWMLTVSAQQRSAPDALRGRLAGLDVACFELAYCGGAVATAALLDAGNGTMAAALPWIAAAAGLQLSLWASRPPFSRLVDLVRRGQLRCAQIRNARKNPILGLACEEQLTLPGSRVLAAGPLRDTLERIRQTAWVRHAAGRWMRPVQVFYRLANTRVRFRGR
jgi:hypothetical protein